jgi:hypothetical protein
MITRQMRREVAQLETLKQVLEQTAPGEYLGGVPPDLDAHRRLREPGPGGFTAS